MRTSILKKVVFILIVLVISLPNFTLCQSGWSVKIEPNSNIGDNNAIKDTGKTILNIIRIIGIAIAVIMVIVLGIKYMQSAPNEKADIKNTAIMFIVGAVIFFAATGILGIIKDWTDDNINNEKGSQNSVGVPGGRREAEEQ